MAFPKWLPRISAPVAERVCRRTVLAGDLESLGLEDAFAEPGVVIIEWAERFTLRTDWPQVAVSFEHLDRERRRISIDFPV